MKLLSSAAVRRCIIADPGKLIITADFDQIELRIAAALSGELALIEAAKRGESLHKVAAIKLFGKKFTPDQYRYTKNVNFGWLYGGGAYTLSEQAGIPYDDALAILKQYAKEFPTLTRYKRDQTEKALRTALGEHSYKTYRGLRSQMFDYRRDTAEGQLAIANVKRAMKRLCVGKIGYVITPFGRRLPVDAERAYATVNYEVQSAAADVLKDALIRVMDEPELEPTVLLPIHDEILGQAWEEEAEAISLEYARIMTTDFMGVPLTASGKVYGKSWGHGYF